MKLYMEYSTNIYSTYLKYISEGDIHVYSIDEAFLDVTEYLGLYNMKAKELAERIIKEIVNKIMNVSSKEKIPVRKGRHYKR